MIGTRHAILTVGLASLFLCISIELVKADENPAELPIKSRVATSDDVNRSDDDNASEKTLDEEETESIDLDNDCAVLPDMDSSECSPTE